MNEYDPASQSLGIINLQFSNELKRLKREVQVLSEAVNQADKVINQKNEELESLKFMLRGQRMFNVLNGVDTTI